MLNKTPGNDTLKELTGLVQHGYRAIPGGLISRVIVLRDEHQPTRTPRLWKPALSEALAKKPTKCRRHAWTTAAAARHLGASGPNEDPPRLHRRTKTLTLLLGSQVTVDISIEPDTVISANPF